MKPLSIVSNLNKNSKIHFIGIGGIGISSVAQWFLAQNFKISGSDIVLNETIKYLSQKGVKIKIGHKKQNISPDIKLVIYNPAINKNNPEIIQAKKYKIPSFSTPQIIGYLTKIYKTIAIAGAHGKSTTTALTFLALKNLNPTVIIGTKLKEFKNNNFYFGQGSYLILEADEYRGSFWNYSPTWAIITNIDREHLDFYKNLKNIKKSFLKFISNIESGGKLILNKDNQLIFGLKNKIEKIAKNKKISIIWYSLSDKEAKKVKKVLKIAGKHNLSNALAVFKLAKLFKIPENKILKNISRYKGAWRRMEYKGVIKIKNPKIKIFVYDDYAHHPNEIFATLEAFKEKYPQNPLICVFEPHQSKRLRFLFKEFGHCFKYADIVFIMPIYKVPGRDIKIPKIFDSSALALYIKKLFPEKEVFYLDNYKKIKSKIIEIFKTQNYQKINQSILIMMGAGNIYKYTSKLIKIN